MPSPNWQGSPSSYKPNPIDDRAIKDPALSSTYLALSAAIEEVTDNIPNAVFRTLDPGTRRGIRSAEHALRRAAFAVVLYADDERVDRT